MPTRHRRSIPVARGPRRKLVWATFDQNVVLPASSPSVTTVDLLSQFELAGASKLGITTMRTHVQLGLPMAAGQRHQVGISVVRDTDIGTIRPNINADNDLDWALFMTYFPTFSGATADAQRVVAIDLKAKRKCQEMGQTWGLTLWDSVTTGETVRVFARTLVALP